jgi:murein L,D-transpeptidase YcbB/YkuD
MKSSIDSLRFAMVPVLAMAMIAVIAARRQPAPPASLKPEPPLLRGQTLTSTGVSTLHAIANSASSNADLRWPSFAPYKREFAKFYEANAYSLAWLQNGRVRPQGLAVMDLLKNANLKGLEPEDYDTSRWPMRLSKLKQNPSEQELISFDTALTVSAMRYIRAVHVGRVNPKEFNFQLDNGDDQFSLADFVQNKVLTMSEPAAEIQKLEPPFPGYRKLLALLPVYEEYARKDDGEKLPTAAKTVRPGQPYACLPRLGRFLQLIGDIPPGVQLDPNATIYEGALVDGLKHYQSRHGEEPTGLLDARTINELDTPANVRIRQIKLTSGTMALAAPLLAQAARGRESSRVSLAGDEPRRHGLLLQKSHHWKSLWPQIAGFREGNPICHFSPLRGSDSQHSAERSGTAHPEGSPLHRETQW